MSSMNSTRIQQREYKEYRKKTPPHREADYQVKIMKSFGAVIIWGHLLISWKRKGKIKSKTTQNANSCLKRTAVLRSMAASYVSLLLVVLWRGFGGL